MLEQKLLKNHACRKCGKDRELCAWEKATIYVWEPNSFTSFGHVAIKIESPRRSYYLSVRPDGITSCCKVWKQYEIILNDEMKVDSNQYKYCSITTLHHLNVDKMFEYCDTLANRVFQLEIDADQLEAQNQKHTIKFNNFGWGKDTVNCLKAVRNVLDAGGFHTLLPLHGHIRSSFHVFFLMLRPVLAVAALTPIYHSFMVNTFDPSVHDHVFVVIGFLLQLIVTYQMDQFWVSAGLLPGLGKYARHRTFIEYGWVSWATQLLGTVGYGLGGLAFIFNLPRNETTHFHYKLFVDFGLWLVVSCVSAFASSFLTSVYLFTCNGSCKLMTPRGFNLLVSNLSTIQNFTEADQRKILLKELNLSWIIVMGFLGTYLAWRFDPRPFEALLLGSFLGSALGLLLTEVSDGLVERFSANSQSYDTQPLQFALISFWIAVGIIGSVRASQAYITQDVEVNMIISMFGSMLGYLIGAYTHLATCSTYNRMKLGIFRTFTIKAKQEDYLPTMHPL